MFTLVITAMFTLAIRKHLVSRISSFSYISREYCPSTNSYLPHNITILFYFNFLPCGKRNLILNLVFVLSLHPLASSFATTNLLLLKLLLGCLRAAALALGICYKRFKKEVNFRSFRVLFSPVEFSIFLLILFCNFHENFLNCTIFSI